MKGFDQTLVREVHTSFSQDQTHFDERIDVARQSFVCLAGVHVHQLAAQVWWSWVGYSWLTSVIDPEEGVVRLAIFASMAAFLVAALCLSLIHI